MSRKAKRQCHGRQRLKTRREARGSAGQPCSGSTLRSGNRSQHGSAHTISGELGFDDTRRKTSAEWEERKA